MEEIDSLEANVLSTNPQILTQILAFPVKNAEYQSFLESTN